MTSTNVEWNPDVLDEKGRQPVSKMNDRAIAEESLVILRAIQDLVEQVAPMFAELADKGPMGMLGMLGGIMGNRK